MELLEVECEISLLPNDSGIKKGGKATFTFTKLQTRKHVWMFANSEIESQTNTKEVNPRSRSMAHRRASRGWDRDQYLAIFSRLLFPTHYGLRRAFCTRCARFFWLFDLRLLPVFSYTLTEISFYAPISINHHLSRKQAARQKPLPSCLPLALFFGEGKPPIFSSLLLPCRRRVPSRSIP